MTHQDIANKLSSYSQSRRYNATCFYSRKVENAQVQATFEELSVTGEDNELDNNSL